jgi:hypothetical protein
MIWHLLKRLLIFPKGLLGGLIAATLMWTVVIFFYNWHSTRSVRKLDTRDQWPSLEAGNISPKCRGLLCCSRLRLVWDFM